jgi:pyrimidine-nucleoside phosphorylase
MLHVAGEARNAKAGQILAEKALVNGSALEKFRALVAAQGGNLAYLDEPNKLPAATMTQAVKSENDGYLARMDAMNIGRAAVMLGAGRYRKNDPIDLAVGIVVHQKVGARIRLGDPLFTIHANNSENLKAAREEAIAGMEIKTEKVSELPLHHGVVE